jgi:phosphohistidine phosphatase
MTLTLMLLRHAKSGHDPGVADIDRRLNARGYQEANATARLIAARNYAPVHIVCSSSRRTRETLAPLIAELGGSASIEVTRQVYDADADELLDLIREQDSEATSLMIVGHNPSLEDLAHALAGSGDGAMLAQLRAGFPPAALAVISFDRPEWRDITVGLGRLEAFETPSD